MIIYFIKAGDFVKIGQTNNIEKRMISLQTGNPCRLEILHTMEVPDEEANVLESNLHYVFRRYRKTGEWFQGCAYVLNSINKIKEIGFVDWNEWDGNRILNEWNARYAGLEHGIREELIKDIKNGDYEIVNWALRELVEMVDCLTCHKNKKVLDLLDTFYYDKPKDIGKPHIYQ